MKSDLLLNCSKNGINITLKRNLLKYKKANISL